MSLSLQKLALLVLAHLLASLLDYAAQRVLSSIQVHVHNSFGRRLERAKV